MRLRLDTVDIADAFRCYSCAYYHTKHGAPRPEMQWLPHLRRRFQYQGCGVLDGAAGADVVMRGINGKIKNTLVLCKQCWGPDYTPHNPEHKAMGWSKMDAIRHRQGLQERTLWSHSAFHPTQKGAPAPGLALGDHPWDRRNLTDNPKAQKRLEKRLKKEDAIQDEEAAVIKANKAAYDKARRARLRKLTEKHKATKGGIEEEEGEGEEEEEEGEEEDESDKEGWLD